MATRADPTPPPRDAFLVINGRRWRRSDPRMPPSLHQELVNELMAGRRAVGAAGEETARREARRRVQDAKVALGERGHAWWLSSSSAEREPRITAATRTLLRSRRDGATICPSEPARMVNGEAWRGLLREVREHAVRLSQSGQLVIRRGRVAATGDLTKGTLRYTLPNASPPKRCDP